MLAYLCAVHNHDDDLRLSRIINNPPRGIGNTTVERARAIAAQKGLSLWAVVSHAQDYPELQKASKRLGEFTGLIQGLYQLLSENALTLPDFYEELLARTGYAIMLESKNTVEDRTRLENVRELLTSINSYLENRADRSESLADALHGFLDEIALYTDIDSHDPSQDCVVMMTMHAAKGLEFPVVFVVGAEEGIFPGIRASSISPVPDSGCSSAAPAPTGPPGLWRRSPRSTWSGRAGPSCPTRTGTAGAGCPAGPRATAGMAATASGPPTGRDGRAGEP